MQNDKHENVELYVPRKCSTTHKILAANDFGSVQINIGEVDANGRLINDDKTNKKFAFSGSVRARGEADAALAHLSA